MKLATTTVDLHHYADSYPKRIALYTKTPFKYLDFGLYLDFLSDSWKTVIEDAKKAAESYGFQFVQAHAADFYPLHPDHDRKTEVLKTERAIEACHMLGIPNVVVHPSIPPGSNVQYPEGREAFFEHNKRAYELLFPAMEKYQVNVLIENSAEVNMKGRYFFMTGQEMRDFLDYVDHPYLKAVWDIGHANLRGNNQYEDLVALGDKLAALHIQDNDGNRDEHTAPFQGTTNMDAIMQGLIDINYKGYFTFESNNFLVRAGSWPYKRRAFEGKQANRLDHPSLELKLMAENLLYEIGRHILTQYDLYED